MSESAYELLVALGRTSVYLGVAALALEIGVRITRPVWPTAHRATWLLVLLMGWTFVRVPLAVPWYEAPRTAPAIRLVKVPLRPAATDPAMPPEPLLLDLGDPTVVEPGASNPQRAAQEPVSWHVDWTVLAAAWVSGIVVLLAVWLAGYLRFWRSLRRCAAADAASQAEWYAMQAEAGLRRPIPLRMASGLGPLLCRLPRGYQLIVDETLWRELSIEERRAVLRHEFAHYLRGDAWKSLVARLLALPHWFNPASWWAVRRFEEAAEWACDRAAVGEASPTEYARLLVRLGQTPLQQQAYGSAVRGRGLAVRVRRVLAGSTSEGSSVKKMSLVAVSLCVASASLVQLQLVAREPHELEGRADELMRQQPNGPTVSPYLNVLQQQATDDSSGAGNTSTEDEDNWTELTTGKKMVEEARGAYEENLAAFEAQTAPMQTVYDWSLRWLKAAEITAIDEEQAVAALRGHLDRMRSLQKKIAQLYKAGTLGADAKEMRATNFYVAEAERWLAEAEGKPSRRNAGMAITREQVADEMQALDLSIKTSEVFGQIAQAEIELHAANKAHANAVQAVKTSPGTISSGEIARMSGDEAKLELRLRILRNQLKLYQRKLDLLNTLQAHDAQKFDSQTSPRRYALAPAPAVGRTPTDKAQARYEGKDFASWAEELRNDLSPQRRAEAIRALAAFGAHGNGPQAAKLILRSARDYPMRFGDADAEVAVDALRKMPANDALPAVFQSLESNIANERRFALAILSNIVERKQVLPIGIKMLKDPFVEVRQTAAIMLSDLEPVPPELIAALREWLASDDPNEVMFAVRAVLDENQGLGRVAVNPRKQLLAAMMPDVLGLLDRGDPINTMAEQALQNMDKTVVPALEEAAKSDNATTRRHAETILEQVRAKPVVDRGRQ